MVEKDLSANRLDMTSQNSQNPKQNSSLTLVKHLTKSEIESLRQSKADAYHKMMKMPL